MENEKMLKLSDNIKNYIDHEIMKSIEEVMKSHQYKQKPISSKEAVKKTEARLFAIPVLKIKIIDDEERIIDLKTVGAPEHSKSLIRYSKNSTRIDPEEALEAMIKQIESSIMINQFEVDTMEKAMEIIKSDPYFRTIESKFFEGLDNETVAELLNCDVTTVWRNRQRLIKNLAIRLYGLEAIE